MPSEPSRSARSANGSAYPVSGMPMVNTSTPMSVVPPVRAEVERVGRDCAAERAHELTKPRASVFSEPFPARKHQLVRAVLDPLPRLLPSRRECAVGRQPAARTYALGRSRPLVVRPRAALLERLLRDLAGRGVNHERLRSGDPFGDHGRDVTV